MTIRKVAHDDVRRYFSQPGLFPRENSFSMSVSSCADMIASRRCPDLW